MGKVLTKGEYYHARDEFSERCKRLGHCLSLAENEEEDAHYWKLYNSTLKRWRRLKIPETVPDTIPAPLLRKTFYRPVFNEEYVMYTRQLKQLYKQREKLSGQKNVRSARTALDTEIERIKKLRQNCTEYIDRATGEPRPKKEQLPKEGEAS